MTDSVVIRAEMLTDVPEKAAESAAAVKALGEDVKSSTGAAGTSSEQLGKHLDTVNQRTEQVANGGAKRLKKAYEDLHESGSKLRESFSSLGESIHHRLMYPMQQLTWMAEGAGAGMVAFGLSTASSLQQANLAMTSFTGSASVASNVVARLRQMQGAVPLGGLTSAYETLSQGGVNQSQLLPLLRGLNSLSEVSLNPQNSMQQMSQAMASMTSTGLLTTQDVNSFSGAGVDVWGMLSRETGQTPQELRMRFLRAGTPMAVPGNFTSDLMAQRGATGGGSAYMRTWAGQFEDVKKSVGSMLAVFETPLGNALAGASGKFDRWATQTEGRFKQLGGSLGSEWSSGNMAGLSNTLARIVGDPKLSGDINVMVTSLHGLSEVVTRSVIPMAHDLVTIANPALHGLADTLGFLGQHKGVTDAMLVTFGGFVVLSKVAQWTSNATLAFRAFNRIFEEKGALTAISAYSRGLTGLAAAEVSAASATEEEALAQREQTIMSGGRGAFGGGASSKLLGVLGGAGGAAMFGTGLYHDLSAGRKASDLSVLGDAVGTGASAGMMFGPMGALVGGLGGAAFGGGYDLMRGLGGLLGGGNTTTTHAQSNTTHIRTVNITVPGAGNPNKVANTIPKALNAQIQAQQARAVRRGSPQAP